MPSRMGGEKTLALRKGHGMRRDKANIRERRAGDGNELHLDGQNRFGDNRKPAFEQQIEHPDDGTSQGILNRGEQRIGRTLGDGAESSVKRRAWHGGDGAAQKLNGGSFTEGARFALKGYAQVLRIEWIHRQALSCNKGSKTKSGDWWPARERISSRNGRCAPA
jgi:hypothetical protein